MNVFARNDKRAPRMSVIAEFSTGQKAFGIDEPFELP